MRETISIVSPFRIGVATFQLDRGEHEFGMVFESGFDAERNGLTSKFTVDVLTMQVFSFDEILSVIFLHTQKSPLTTENICMIPALQREFRGIKPRFLHPSGPFLKTGSS